uniref:Partner of Y14 and mago n=1 Tax=Lynceus sp. MCZ IZ 141354 TaxID=1930659 RepID=A0A9N6ZHI7_9CRUS|nr:EOG090X0KVN [Lynceus sp. MCZ IZ 141354]
MSTSEFQPVRDGATGELFIPATRRADGTWRKPIRVKEGYVPQEEVPLYESKGKQFAKSRPQYPVGMTPELANSNRQNTAEHKPYIPGLPTETAPKTSKKKKKKSKEAEVQAVVVEEPFASGPAVKHEPPKEKSVEKITKQIETTAISGEPVTDPAKRLKNLKKKLRDIEALEEKQKSGQVAQLDKDQMEKIRRKAEVVKEIRQLEKLVK